MGCCFTNLQFKIINVFRRDGSPPAIKSEPEEDNGFYPSPQHNKTFKREYDYEEWVSLKLIKILSSVQFSSFTRVFVNRFECKPKKVKVEHDKKAKKRKQEYEEDEEDEVLFFFINACRIFELGYPLFESSRFILFSLC